MKNEDFFEYNSVDVFSMTNPALGSLVLGAFIDGYCETSNNAPEHPLLFIPLPLILSEDIIKTLENKNIKTGFFSWLNENQHIKFEINNKIILTKQITTQSLLFGIKYRLIDINSEYLFIKGANLLKSIKNAEKDLYISNILKKSKLIGKWMGLIDSTKHIYIGLGLYDTLEY